MKDLRAWIPPAPSFKSILLFILALIFLVFAYKTFSLLIDVNTHLGKFDELRAAKNAEIEILRSNHEKDIEYFKSEIEKAHQRELQLLERYKSLLIEFDKLSDNEKRILEEVAGLDSSGVINELQRISSVCCQ